MNKRQAKKRRRIGKALYMGDMQYKHLIEMLYPNCGEEKCEIYVHVNKSKEE